MSSDDNNSVRLNKFIALHAGLSRREADDFIRKGHVMINGERAVMGARVNSDDVVEVHGEKLNNHTAYIYIMLHKPIGYVCSRRQQGDSPTIYDLLPDEYHTLKPVGRLDRDSTGLILLTNDGDFAQQMTHPSYRKVKRYDVIIDKPLEPLHQQMISDFGVDLEDGKSKLTLERQSDSRLDWTVTMSEGRNRQIRRTFLALGYMVTKLHRSNFGTYNLGDLQSGKFIVVDKQ